MARMHQGCYFTYIMASRSRTLYIGVTGDLNKRVFQHKWKEHEGFTSRYNCDRLIWFESHQDVQRAIAREKELKGWRRARKIALIEWVNPSWCDLSQTGTITSLPIICERLAAEIPEKQLQTFRLCLRMTAVLFDRCGTI